MAKAIKVYKGGIHSLIEAAVRADGAEFRRYQNKTLFGYRWTAWRATGMQHDVTNLPTSLSAGFSTMYPPQCPRNVRLPN